MTPAEATRPVLIALAFASSLAVAGCGAVDSDPHRFSAMAENVAAIDIPLSAGDRETRHAVAEKAGLRPVRFTPAILREKIASCVKPCTLSNLTLLYGIKTSKPASKAMLISKGLLFGIGSSICRILRFIY